MRQFFKHWTKIIFNPYAFMANLYKTTEKTTCIFPSFVKITIHVILITQFNRMLCYYNDQLVKKKSFSDETIFQMNKQCCL